MQDTLTLPTDLASKALWKVVAEHNNLAALVNQAHDLGWETTDIAQMHCNGNDSDACIVMRPAQERILSRAEREVLRDKFKLNSLAGKIVSNNVPGTNTYQYFLIEPELESYLALRRMSQVDYSLKSK